MSDCLQWSDKKKCSIYWEHRQKACDKCRIQDADNTEFRMINLHCRSCIDLKWCPIIAYDPLKPGDCGCGSGKYSRHHKPHDHTGWRPK